MKRVLYLSMKVLLLMMLPMMVACGDDNDNGSGKIDGVNVTNGKRLIQIGDNPAGLKIEYDTKGRINRILANEIDTHGNTNFREIGVTCKTLC